MALPTTQHGSDPAQRPTQGVATTPGSVAKMGPSPTMAGPAQTPETEPAKPVLWEDIDPVLLMRLYPKAKGADEARQDAMKAADQAYAMSTKLQAAQQVPSSEQMGEPGPGIHTTAGMHA